MIFPYEIVQGSTTARLLQPHEMAQRYPGCLAYLTARRVDLDRRHVTGGAAAQRQFYQFGRSQSLTKFDSPKIILPILSLNARYAYDDNDIVVTGGGQWPLLHDPAPPRRGRDKLFSSRCLASSPK